MLGAEDFDGCSIEWVDQYPGRSVPTDDVRRSGSAPFRDDPTRIPIVLDAGIHTLGFRAVCQYGNEGTILNSTTLPLEFVVQALDYSEYRVQELMMDLIKSSEMSVGIATFLAVVAIAATYSAGRRNREWDEKLMRKLKSIERKLGKISERESH